MRRNVIELLIVLAAAAVMIVGSGCSSGKDSTHSLSAARHEEKKCQSCPKKTCSPNARKGSVLDEIQSGK